MIVPTEYALRPILFEDREAIMDIFNHYAETSFAAYPETKLPYHAFDLFLKMSEGYPRASVLDQQHTVVGFGMLRPHNMLPTFSQTAEVTYFIDPAHTGRGIGKLLLRCLEEGAREKGIQTILANISSRNEPSIQFHEKNGFVQVGRLAKVGKKLGLEFDTIWMQKAL